MTRLRTAPCQLMGILNVTPDSFSDGGRFNNPESAVQQARQMVAEGAAILDIGAESTRPGAAPISAAEERERLLPVLRAVREAVAVPLSVDTSKAEVADAALAAGANWINDVHGLRRDPAMAAVAARHDCGLVVMHNQEGTSYPKGLITTVVASLCASIDEALAAGVRRSRIVLDPGIGFGKTAEQNRELLASLSTFTALGYPVLLGVSRKSVIGKTLDLPVDQRLEATLATSVLAVLAGVAILRVHDVEANRRAVRMTEAILNQPVPVSDE